jgi:hypothetical protein
LTGNVATRGPESESAARPALADRLREARARLEPPTVTVPAPRSAEGVVPAPNLRVDPDAPPKDLLAAVDGLVEELEAVESDQDDATHRTLCRIAELVREGVPEAGWSGPEEIDVDVLQATSEAARTLHGKASALLERLDDEKRHGPAAVVDSVATTLRVVGVVADLEVFERARH